jgi:hypothetical protein
VRLAVLYDGEILNPHYRAILPLRALEQRGHHVLWPINPSFSVGLGELPDCELVHIHRCMMEKDLTSVERLRARGIAVVWDNDDDIGELPRSTRRMQRMSKRGAREYFARSIEIAKRAHLMTTPSPYLAELYRDAGVEHVTVIANALAPQDVMRNRRRHAGVVIGCTTAAEHQADLKRLGIGKVLDRIMQANPAVRVVAIGNDFGIRSPRYARHQFVPIARLIEAESDFDIGIAPLLDSPFNRARSDVKLREYASAGAMWLASPVGPYVGLGEEQGGLLVDDDDWYATIEGVVRDYERRDELMGRARDWARAVSMQHAVLAWEKAFTAAIRRARAGGRTAAPAPGPA